MRRFRTVVSGAALAFLVFTGIACKQGRGQRCEIDSDCEDGLTCSQMGAASGPNGTCGGGMTTMDAAFLDTGGGNDAPADMTSTTDGADDAGDDTSSGDAASGGDAVSSPDTADDATAD